MSYPGIGITRLRYDGFNLSQSLHCVQRLANPLIKPLSTVKE